jgi:hypothetical protein
MGRSSDAKTETATEQPKNPIRDFPFVRRVNVLYWDPSMLRDPREIEAERKAKKELKA